VEFSVQDPATDTLAIDETGEPCRDKNGELVLRPSGHGALLGNLARAPLVAAIKNIDNVAAEPFAARPSNGCARFVGRVLELRAQSHALVLRLEDPGDAEAIGEARRFAARRGWAESRRTPRRSGRAACNARSPGARVRHGANTGEPRRAVLGVRPRRPCHPPDRRERQVRAGDSRQLAVFQAATHFNPVFSRAPSTTPAAGASTSANSSTPTR